MQIQMKISIMASSFFALFLSILLLAVYQEAMALDIPQQHAFNDWNIKNNILSTLQIGGRFDFPLLKLYNICHFGVNDVFNDELIIRYPFSNTVPSTPSSKGETHNFMSIIPSTSTRSIHHGNRKVLRRRHLIEAKGSISTNAPGSR
uniref:Transmembrane protein n=1 Tax=Spongospora subterranea TaxID=70186 RepID=A0A0H5RD56_9EUKA|eukprot:CRZ11918.1 hypothetical protein [Spongospora subterranea]